MTKYSLENMKDDYEPEEGEIQDDDDQMEEVPVKTAVSAASNKGSDRETCSKSVLLSRRDESKSCSRKSNCNTYGGKPYYTSGASHDAFISSHSSSRTRYRTSPSHKWYHTHRQNSSSKEWGISKASMAQKDRERCESKRTPRNQYYYSSFLSPQCDQRSIPIATPGNSCLNTSIPPWHWYSKHVKDKNKKACTSSSKMSDTVRPITSSNSSQFNTFTFSINSMINTEKNTTVENNEKNSLEKHSHPGSPTSTNSIEIIDVPPKIPEIITIYDSDEEPCKEPNEISSRTATNSPRKTDVTVDSQDNSSASEMTQEPCQLKDILQGNYRSSVTQDERQKNNEDRELHLKELTFAMKSIYDERKKKELNLQQNSNIQEINLSIEESASSLAQNKNGDNNLLVSQVNNECAIVTDMQGNTNERVFDKCIDDSEKNVNNGRQNDEYWERNIENNVPFDAQPEISASQPTLNLMNMNINETSHQNVHLSPLISCSTNTLSHSPCSLSSPKPSAEYVIGDEFSSDFMMGVNPQSQIYSANSEEFDNSKTSESPTTLPIDGPMVQHIVQHSIYSPTVFQTDEMITTPGSEIHSSQNPNCSCQKNVNVSGYKCSSYISPSLRINRNINYSNLTLIIPTNEKINSSNQHKVIESEITDNRAKGADNTISKNSPCIQNDKESNSTISNSETSHDGFQEDEGSEISQNVTNQPVINIIQTQCSTREDEMDNKSRNSSSQSDRNAYTEPEITRDESINDLLSQECTVLSKSMENVQNNGLINDTKNVKNMRKENTLTKSIGSVQASTVAALKRRATELKKLQHHKSETNISSLRKGENQRLIPSVVINKKLRDTAFSLPSHTPTSRPFNENDGKTRIATRQVKKGGGISGYAINSLSEKCLTYTSPPLVYEDRIGAKMDMESGHFSEQMTNRINVTVPEFIINLGKESDSGDDSDDDSSRSKTADDNTPEMKEEQKNNISIIKTISTDFEKKLEVLLKQARSQQESSEECVKGSMILSEQLATSTEPLNRHNEIFAPVYTTFLHKNTQSPSAVQGCARAIPRSTVKKMACSRAAKTKMVNHRIKSVIIKNSSGTVNHDRTIPNDRTIKHSTSVTINSYKQANKGWTRNVGSKGKISRQTSSMGDIGLLPPLKQKEYMKLKRQLVQMTQRKRDIRNKEKSESVAHADRSNKQEEAKLKQTDEKTGKMKNYAQEVTTHPLVTVEDRENLLPGVEQMTEQESLQISSRNMLSEIQINDHQIISSESHSCNQVQIVNIVDKEENALCDHIPKTNVTRSELIEINNSQNTSLTDSHENTDSQHQREFSPTSLERQTSKLISNTCDPGAIIHNGENMLSGKRKLAINTLEQEQKKQKIVSEESEHPTSEMQKTTFKEIVSNNSNESNLLVENLWSSETKLIARRRQVLEDIATVRLQLHKIEAANFRKDLLVKNIYRLKDELNISEEKLRQEEECVKTLNDVLNNSRLVIQRGQSELLSLSLECEELGCKVHGPPNYNVPKTCVDLIRNEMLAMTEAMQELENQKNAM